MITIGLVLALVALVLVVATLVVAARGGRGPGEPPASHPRHEAHRSWVY